MNFWVSKKTKQILLTFLLLVLVSVFLHMRTDVVPDVDSFYHIRHAQIYQSGSILDSSFPWAQYSVINSESADLWYGFHILLIPFTFFPNLLVGITFAGALLTIISLFLIFLALKKLKVRWPIFWVFVFLFSAPDVLYRFGMLRPHLLSLGLALLIFAYFVEADQARINTNSRSGSGADIFLLFFTSALFAWVHLALAWLPVLIAVLVGAIRLIKHQSLGWSKIGALIGGLVLGVFLRPNPIGALKLVWVQTGMLLTQRLGELPIRFGRELTPFVWVNFLDQLLPITILLVMGIVALIWFLKRSSKPGVEVIVSLWSSLILSFGFLYLTFWVARRSAELFVIFSVLFLALIFTSHGSDPWGMWGRHRVLKRAIFFIVVLTLVYMPIKTIYRYTKFWDSAFPAHQFEEVGNWLKDNASPEEIVFSPHWDRFAQLFFWSPQNYYINGMDPIFIFARSPELYWKTHFLATDEGGAFTCAMPICSALDVESTYNVLKEDFKASYVVVERLRSPNFFSYLSLDSGFEKVFDNSVEVIYSIR